MLVCVQNILSSEAWQGFVSSERTRLELVEGANRYFFHLDDKQRVCVLAHMLRTLQTGRLGDACSRRFVPCAQVRRCGDVVIPCTRGVRDRQRAARRINRVLNAL